MAVERIGQALRFGIQGRTIESIVQTGAPLAELANDLMNLRSRMMNFGRRQVTDELKRQAR